MAALAATPAAAFDGTAKAVADPFALGVASGDPDSNGFVLWTRLVGPVAQPLEAGALLVGYEIAEDPGFRRIVRAGGRLARPEHARGVASGLIRGFLDLQDRTKMTHGGPTRKRRQRVCLLGATGTIGPAITAALLERGHDVFCFVRAGTAGNGVTVRVVDVTDPLSLARDGFAGKSLDALVSCMASRTGVPEDG